MALAETAQLATILTLKDGLSTGLGRTIGAVKRFDSGIGRAGKGVGQFGKGVARAGVAVAGFAAAGLGVAAKAAIDWEDAFQGVVKTVDAADLAASGLTFDDLAESLRKMAREMPNTATELAGIAEQAGALGIRGKDIEAFTKQVAILASTTDVSAEDAATALGQLQNVIGLTGQQFDNFAAALVDLGNKGASTEGQILEIARRAGGAAKLFGIAKDETLGWAAAAANLGLESELAGTALQNVFVKLLPLYNKGSKKLQAITGLTGKQLRKSFKEDAGGALEFLIKKLGKLSKSDRLDAVQSLFAKGSGITRLVLDLADSYEKNLAPALDTSTAAWKEATAAQEEFDKRNVTVRSAISRLRNNVMDAAITIGEGFAPALGEAADKLSEFLAQDENRRALKDLGEDIGEAIKSINWKSVIDGAKSFSKALKPALDAVIAIAEAIAKLPPEVIGAGGAAILANTASGGLIGQGAGNVIGGLGESLAKSLASKIPLFGNAFVQPVFVTNMGLSGAGSGVPAGAAGAAGGAGKVTKALSIAAVVGSAVAVWETQQQVSGASTAQANELKATLDAGIRVKTPQELETALVGVNQGIRDLRSNPLYTLVQGDALNTLHQMASDIRKQQETNAAPAFRSGERVTSASDTAGAVDKLRASLAAVINAEGAAIRSGDTRRAATLEAKADALRAKIADASSKADQDAATMSGKIGISNARLAAIQAKRTSFTTNVSVNTDVSINTITKKTVYVKRVAKSSGLGYD